MWVDISKSRAQPSHIHSRTSDHTAESTRRQLLAIPKGIDLNPQVNSENPDQAHSESGLACESRAVRTCETPSRLLTTSNRLPLHSSGLASHSLRPCRRLGPSILPWVAGFCPGSARAASLPAPQPPGCLHHPHWKAHLEGPGWPVSTQLHLPWSFLHC